MHNYQKKTVSDEEQTEFNSGIATLKRIDKIKQFLDDANASDNYEMRYRYLKVLYMELVSIMDSDDDAAQKIRFREVRQKFSVYQEAMRRGLRSVPRDVIDILDDWEIELKNIEQSYGLNMPKKSDPRYALAGR